MIRLSYLLRSLLGTVLLLYLVPAWSCPEGNAADYLQAWLKAQHHKTWQFKHNIYQDDRLISTQTGHIAYAKPGKVGIVIEGEAKQKIILHEHKLYDYDPELAQVIVYQNLDDMASPLLLFLAGVIKDVPEQNMTSSCNGQQLTIQVKHAEQSIQFKLTQGQLKFIDWVDNLDQRHALVLSHAPGKWSNLDSQPIFPDGTEIIED